MKTKSLSLLIVLAICITIGGVYATWLYAEQDMTAVHGHIGSFGLANAEINNSKGTITVDASNAHLVIDQSATDNYKAKLDATGTILVKFSPSQIFKDSNPTLNEIEMQYYIVTDNSAPTEFTCNDGTGDKALFTTFDKATKTDITLVKQSDGTYQATIDAKDILNRFVINDFVLDTYEKYIAFSGKVGIFGNIGVEVDEK